MFVPTIQQRLNVDTTQNQEIPPSSSENKLASNKSDSSGSGSSSINRNIENIESQCRPALHELAKQEASQHGLDAADIETLLTSIDKTHQKEVPEQAKKLLTTHLHHNPALLGIAIKYINAQLMIMNTAETILASQQHNPEEKIEHSLKALDHSLTLSRSNSSVGEKLSRMKASPVITGHPTHLNKPETVHKLLNQMLEVNDAVHVDEFCQNLWEGLGHREERPTVQQEAEHYAPYLKNMINASHKIQKKVHSALQKLQHPKTNSPLIEIGSWVAGDRDGNPNISAQTLRDVVINNSKQVFSFYNKKLRDDGSLSIRSTEIGIEQDISQINSLHSFGIALKKAGLTRELKDIRKTLQNTERMLTGGDEYRPDQPVYNNPSEFESALQDLTEDLAIPELTDKVDRLCIDIQGKGFYGASTDIRQNSAMNEKTVGHLLRLSGIHPDYSSLGEEARCTVLLDVLNKPENFRLEEQGDDVPPAIRNELELIHAYKDIQDTFGEKALKNCITANTETASDMLEVIVLMKQAGLVDKDGLKMNVMPLIETVPDLENGPKILDTILQIPWYKEQLAKSDNTQHVMVGYSDSCRLDGPLASSWSVYAGIHNIQQTLEKHGIHLHVFHGRGGTEARGSGHSYEQDIEYLDGNSLAEGFRQTEQGEEVPAKFGNRQLSEANLIDMLGTAISTSAQGKDQHMHTYGPVMEELKTHARAAYQTLYNDKDLVPFFRNTTPIDFVKLSNAGSRPASRKQTSSNKEYLENIRAIPWAAAWYQNGSMMPAYYGIGSALKTYCTEGKPSGAINPEKLNTLKTMYETWPFFKNLVDRTDLALYKVNMPLAQKYAELDPPTQHIFENIKHEFNTTDDMLSLIKPQTDAPRTSHIKNGIRARQALRDWTQTLQIGLLKAVQDAGDGPKAEPLKPLLVQTMQANANSLGRFG
jgi:phosphoenolpyruvate carboxylase